MRGDAKEVVIAMDQGSSSSRALAFDSKGRVVARAQFPVKTFLPKPGWVEHDALDLARTLERAFDAVLDKLPRLTRVVGVGMAAQRSTVVLWDAKTGKPVGRAPSWQDARAAADVAPLQSDMKRQEEVHAKSGLYLLPFYSAPKIRYQVTHVPAARRLLEQGRLRAGPVSCFALWRLTKGETLAVDPAMAQRMLLYNLRTGDWDEDLLTLFGIPKSCLPAILPTAGRWGVIARKGRRMPVLAVMGDQQAAALGVDVDSPGVGVLNYGTGAFFLLHTGEEIHRLPGILTSVAWRREARPCRYFLEGTVNAAGPSLRWLRENLGLLKDVRAADAACRRSKRRLFALQSLGGLGAPRWDPRTPTVLWGLGLHTSRDDVVRSVVEAVGFLIADIVATIRGAGLGVLELRASGGLARIDSLLRFQADILQQRISRLKEREATALGAASLAAEQSGAPWGAGLRKSAIERSFKPGMDADEASRLHQGWRKFVATQQKLAAELAELRVF